MTPNVYLNKMVYSLGEEMWHALTKPSTVAQSGEQVMENNFGGGFTVSLRPLTVYLNGEMRETGDYAIVRDASLVDPSEVVFDYCTSRYHPLQPMAVAKSFDKNVGQPVETMAFLGNGNDMFISWVLPECEAVVGDLLKMYGIVRTSFTTMKATKLFTSTYRPVCQNTITLAENEAIKHTDKDLNRGMLWKGKGTNPNLLEELGYWMAFVQERALRQSSLICSLFGKLATVPIKTDAEAQGILLDAFPNRGMNLSNIPPQLRGKKEEETLAWNESQRVTRDSIFGMFAGAGTAITPDGYGMVNAASEWVCHCQPSKKPIAESVMWGARHDTTLSVIEAVQKFSEK